MPRIARQWGRHVRREWKLLLAFVLLWYLALVLGQQVLAGDRHTTTTAPPTVPPAVGAPDHPAV